MVNRRRVANRNPRRSKRSKRMRKSRPRLPRSAIRNPAVVTVKIPAIRELNVYPKQVTTTISEFDAAAPVPENVWLDSLKIFGIIALRLFIILVSSVSIKKNKKGDLLSTEKAYVTSAVQSIFIGSEDLVMGSAIAEVEEIAMSPTDRRPVPCLDFIQAKMTSAVIRLTCGSAVSSRAGRYVACVLDLTEEELLHYVDANADYNEPKLIDTWSFAEVVQMPGAVTAPYGTPLTLNWRAKPSSYANRFLEIGTSKPPSPAQIDKNPKGGRPSFRLILGYQDFASSKGSISSMYSPDEAMMHIDIRAHVMMREKGRRYIRKYPQVSMDALQATVYDAKTGRETIESLTGLATDSSGMLYRVKAVTLDSCSME